MAVQLLNADSYIAISRLSAVSCRMPKRIRLNPPAEQFALFVRAKLGRRRFDFPTALMSEEYHSAIVIVHTPPDAWKYPGGISAKRAPESATDQTLSAATWQAVAAL